MKSHWLVAPILLCAELSAQLTATDPAPAEKPQTSGIRGIFLTGKREEVLPGGRPFVKGIQAVNIDVPGGSQALTDQLRPFVGKPLTKKTLIEIKQKIVLFYVKQGIKMVGVEVPAQKLNGGVVQFLVIRKSFGKPIYKGESMHNNEKLNRILGVSPGQNITESVLQDNLSWLNRNAFQSNSMRYVRTDDQDVLDIEFTSRKRRPVRLYVRGDNTGTATTGWARLYTGASWGNAFGRGDILSFEYTTSDKLRRLQKYSSNYTAFLPWQHILTVYGTYIHVVPKVKNLQIVADAWQFRARYNVPFKPLYTPFLQNVQVGFDVKYATSNVLNLAQAPGRVQVVRVPIERTSYITNFVSNYTLYNRFRKHSVSLNINFIISPFKFLPGQTQKNYTLIRTHARPQYYYLKVTAGDVITIPKTMIISILLRAQLANNTLPAAELMNMGGYSTVRGYIEAVANGDNGFIGNLELRTLPISVYPKNKKARLTLLCFVDYGLSNNWFIRQRRTPGSIRIPHTLHLLGAGPGLRYNIRPNFELRCDYGFQLHKMFASTPRLKQVRRSFGELHIGALASY